MESPLGKNLSRLVRTWRALIDHRLKPLKLTQTHWTTLYNICQLPPNQSQIQLAKAIGIEQPSLVRTLDQLESKGLIMRSICAHDRRTKRIKLTDKAESIINKVNHLLKNTRTDIFYNISDDDIQHINIIINKLAINIINLYNRT